MAYRIEVSADGVVRLPSEIIERHGLSEGGVVIVEDRDNSIVIRTYAEAIAEIQQWSRDVLGDKGFTVDDFIAERRREAERELSEY